MSVDNLDGFSSSEGGFPSGELVVIVAHSKVGKSAYKEVIRKDLRDMVRDYGPLDWSQFQRMASAGYGTGAVGRLQADRQFQEQFS